VKQVIFDYSSDDISTAVVDFWHVDEGDSVEAGDDLVELRTEEGALFVVPAPVGGILRERFYEPGDEVEVGDVIATIDDGIESFAAADLDEDEDEEEEEEEEEEDLEDVDEDDEAL